MTLSNLPYDGSCTCRIKITVQGESIELTDALIDTGFVSSSGYGLKLPKRFEEKDWSVGSASVRLANNQKTSAILVYDVYVTELESQKILTPIKIPTIILEGNTTIIGMMFLQKCVIKLDGPNKSASIDVQYS